MTLHVTVKTEKHIVTACDRLISTEKGEIEMGQDLYKHLVFICDGFRGVVSFSGFAGITKDTGDSSKMILEEATLDWITDVLSQTQVENHGFQDHIEMLGREMQPRIEYIMRKFSRPMSKLGIAVQVTGWCGDHIFSWFVDNYMDERMRSQQPRSRFKVHYKLESPEELRTGPKIMILGRNDLISHDKREFLELRHACASPDPKDIWRAAVALIRSVAPASNGGVGFNCSGLRLTARDPGIEGFDSRDDSIWDCVMPNVVKCRDGSIITVADMRGTKNPKEGQKEEE